MAQLRVLSGMSSTGCFTKVLLKHPLDVLLDVWVDTIFSVFLNAKMRPCFDSNKEIVLEKPGELYFSDILILLTH